MLNTYQINVNCEIQVVGSEFAASFYQLFHMFEIFHNEILGKKGNGNTVIYKRDLQRGYPAQTMTQRLEVKAAEDKQGFLLCHVKGFRIYLKSNEQPLNDFKQRSDKITFSFQENHSGDCVKN